MEKKPLCSGKYCYEAKFCQEISGRFLWNKHNDMVDHYFNASTHVSLLISFWHTSKSIRVDSFEEYYYVLTLHLVFIIIIIVFNLKYNEDPPGTCDGYIYPYLVNESTLS